MGMWTAKGLISIISLLLCFPKTIEIGNCMYIAFTFYCVRKQLLLLVLHQPTTGHNLYLSSPWPEFQSSQICSRMEENSCSPRMIEDVLKWFRGDLLPYLATESWGTISSSINWLKLPTRLIRMRRVLY